MKPKPPPPNTTIIYRSRDGKRSVSVSDKEEPMDQLTADLAAAYGEVNRLKTVTAKMLVALKLYRDVYDKTGTHPTVIQEAMVMVAVRDAIAAAEKKP